MSTPRTPTGTPPEISSDTSSEAPAERRASYALPGMIVTNHRFELPLDHANPGGEKITVFARELAAPGAHSANLPYLLYLQGGPGFPSPRPAENSGWIGRALREYRVLLLDQRGTGLSSPVSAATLTARGDAHAQAHYLTHFRADSIIEDAELIRRELTGGEQWAVLGQSFGGFCVLTYLSRYPEALLAAFITGGIPSLDGSAESVYRATYPRVLAKNREFFARYPHAQALAQRVAEQLSVEGATLPNGQAYTVEQFQQLGFAFGATGGYEEVIDLLERALISVNGRQQLSYEFKHRAFATSGFNTNPIFSLLHEAIYCQNAPGNRTSNWAAERVRGEFPEFDYSAGGELLFTGEMIYPWMFEQFQELMPLKETAELLAKKDDWPALYDPAVLAKNRVPAAAALYFHDMYVDLNIALTTAERIPNLSVWVTSEFEHNGLRASGERILSRLIDMLPPIT